MFFFWQTKKYMCIFNQTSRKLIQSIVEDSRNIVIDIGRSIAINTNQHSKFKKIAKSVGVLNVEETIAQETRSIKCSKYNLQNTENCNDNIVIFASICVSKHDNGGIKYCGGYKELNCLVKFLRIKGYEAYLVTYDGTYEPWLIDHQPHISLEEFRKKLGGTSSVRCVTSWAVAEAFIDHCDSLYFWDMELCCTDRRHYSKLHKLYKKKIRNTASISRTIQAFHMARFDKYGVVIPNLIDESTWYPVDTSRQTLNVGYMNEGPHTDNHIETIRNYAENERTSFSFHQISGDEADVLAGMRSCAVFLSMNIGKDILWGEGCPRTILEALSAGCIVIGYDIIGNKETLINNYNGFIVERNCPELMAETLVRLYKTQGLLSQMQSNSKTLINNCHTLEARWPAIRDFLEL